jgi:ammonia channel protein AmtB
LSIAVLIEQLMTGSTTEKIVAIAVLLFAVPLTYLFTVLTSHAIWTGK